MRPVCGRNFNFHLFHRERRCRQPSDTHMVGERLAPTAAGLHFWRTGPMTAESPKKFKEPIAIVGIGCRLPGGIKDPESFYEFLKEKRSAIAEVPKDRWSDSFYDAEPGVSGKATTKWGGFVDDLYGFDPQFFD